MEKAGCAAGVSGAEARGRIEKHPATLASFGGDGGKERLLAGGRDRARLLDIGAASQEDEAKGEIASAAEGFDGGGEFDKELEIGIKAILKLRWGGAKKTCFAEGLEN